MWDTPKSKTPQTIVPISSPRDLPNPGIEPKALASPALTGGFFTTVPPGIPIVPRKEHQIEGTSETPGTCT